jgi:hypothetical protein
MERIIMVIEEEEEGKKLTNHSLSVTIYIYYLKYKNNCA